MIEDEKIIEMFFERSEQGIRELDIKYGTVCHNLSYHIVGSNTIGGFANWVQDWEYRECPECGRKMKYLAQIHWDTIEDCAEGTLFIEICPDCKIITMFHQQT